MINYIPPVQKEVKPGESIMSHDIFMNALREVNPGLASIVDFVKDQNSDNDRVRTFEDCARVEQDIMSRLNSVNPFKG